MSNSKQEEIICSLWAICSLLAYQSGHDIWGGIFAIKSILDLVCVFTIAIGEIKSEAK